MKNIKSFNAFLNEGVLITKPASSYKIGDILELDWDGPSNARVIDFNKSDKTYMLARLDKHGNLMHPLHKNTIEVSAGEIEEMMG